MARRAAWRGTDNSFRTTYTITMSRTSAQCSGRRSVGRLAAGARARGRMKYYGFWIAIRLTSPTAFRSLARVNADAAVTATSVRVCPGPFGGQERNGSAYDMKLTLLVVPTTDWCRVQKGCGSAGCGERAHARLLLRR